MGPKRSQSAKTRRLERRMLSFAIAGFLSLASAILAAEERALFEGFKPDWRLYWREQRLFSKSTNYSIVHEDGQPVLHTVSNAANSCLLRKVAIISPAKAN